MDTPYKALIIAAGMGRRLDPLTNDLPKCMLDFGGRTLLQRQLDAFAAAGVRDVSVIRGFQAHRIDYPNLRYFENPDYADNNILCSLFHAEAALEGHVVVAYSDILFEARVAEAALDSEHDIAVVVDTDWRAYYDGRDMHPIEEAENVTFDDTGKVVEIGKILADKDNVDGEFIGMMKLNPRGCEILREQFHRAREAFGDGPFQRAAHFQKAYLTDLLQEMVDRGVPVHCALIERGWKEIDTNEDYRNALAAYAT